MILCVVETSNPSHDHAHQVQRSDEDEELSVGVEPQEEEDPSTRSLLWLRGLLDDGLGHLWLLHDGSCERQDRDARVWCDPLVDG